MVATRRSAKVDSKQEGDAVLPTPTSNVSDYTSDVESPDDEVRPPKKKQKKSAHATRATAVKKRGGRLRKLAEMPVDVLLEVRLTQLLVFDLY